MTASCARTLRAKRASQLIDGQLAEQSQIDMEYLRSMQLDVHDLGAEEMVDEVLRKLNLDQVLKEHTVTLPQWVQSTMSSVIPNVIRGGVEVKAGYYNDSVNREKAVYGWRLLSEWDFEFTTDSLAATIFEAFQLVLVRRVIITGIYRGFSDSSQRTSGDEKVEELVTINDDEETLRMAVKLSENIMLQAYNWSFCGAPRFYYKRVGPMLSMLGCDVAEEDCWWIRNYGSRENLVTISLIDAVDCIAFWSKTEDRSKWELGSLHQIEAQHPVSAKLGPKPFNSKTYPVGGSQSTLQMFCPRQSRITEDPMNVGGAVVYRHIIDCDDWKKSKWVLPPGASGELASPFYQNQLTTFVEGQYIPMLWDEDDVEENKSSEIVCDPFKNINDEISSCRLM